MKTKIENISGCRWMLNIEVSPNELDEKLDQVYRDIGKVARVPGYRPGHIPRDLLENFYREKAEEDVIKRAIPEYYLKAVREEKLLPVAPPEIENVQIKDHILYFSARVDLRPKLSLKPYKNLKIIKKKVKIESSQVDQMLENLRENKAKEVKIEEKNKKEKVLPQLDDAFAQSIGFATLQELKDAVKTNLEANAQKQLQVDMERQIIDQLFKRASFDIPESLVNRQMQELLNQLKLNHILQGAKKDELQAKAKEWQDEAREESIRRVKLSFILEEVAQRENIQVNEEDLSKRIEEISQRAQKTTDEVKHYLETENLIPSLKAELQDKKTMEFLLKEASIVEEK